jgi:hypothetical protein
MVPLHAPVTVYELKIVTDDVRQEIVVGADGTVLSPAFRDDDEDEDD